MVSNSTTARRQGWEQEQSMTVTHHWTVADLEQLPSVEGNRYEIVGGELYVSKQPHIHHQQVCHRIGMVLGAWNDRTGLGRVIPAPGVILSDEDAVAPDLIWASNTRFLSALGQDGKLHEAPELVVEVLSAGRENELRDRDLKLSLYSRYGVVEYWLIDWRARCVEVYSTERAQLIPAGTLRRDELLQTSLLPGFSCEVESLFIGIPTSHSE
jgi:Uma2 family endonuclease